MMSARIEDLIIAVLSCLGLFYSLIVPPCLSLGKLFSLYILKTLVKHECFKCSSRIASHLFLMRLRGKSSVSENDTILSNTGFESYLDRKKKKSHKKEMIILHADLDLNIAKGILKKQIHIYVCVYIYREREREREVVFTGSTGTKQNSLTASEST